MEKSISIARKRYKTHSIFRNWRNKQSTVMAISALLTAVCVVLVAQLVVSTFCLKDVESKPISMILLTDPEKSIREEHLKLVTQIEGNRSLGQYFESNEENKQKLKINIVKQHDDSLEDLRENLLKGDDPSDALLEDDDLLANVTLAELKV